MFKLTENYSITDEIYEHSFIPTNTWNFREIIVLFSIKRRKVGISERIGLTTSLPFTKFTAMPTILVEFHRVDQARRVQILTHATFTRLKHFQHCLERAFVGLKRMH